MYPVALTKNFIWGVSEGEADLSLGARGPNNPAPLEPPLYTLSTLVGPFVVKD